MFILYEMGTPKMYQIKTTHRFDLWFEELKDRSAKTPIQMRIDRVESGHFGDCEPVGNGISEWKYQSQAVMCCN